MKPVYLTLTRHETPLPAGASRFWGNPDLPRGTAYPMYTGDDGEEYPYTFICQINLGELARFAPGNPLPHTGLLAFFARIDNYLGDYSYPPCIGGSVSGREAVKVLWFPDCGDTYEAVLVDDDDKEVAPAELHVGFSHTRPADENALFAAPDHRPWEEWDAPCTGWQILLQVDSFEGDGFELNFMDTGVLDLLISPDDLRRHRFDRVRAIVLST